MMCHRSAYRGRLRFAAATLACFLSLAAAGRGQTDPAPQPPVPQPHSPEAPVPAEVQPPLPALEMEQPSAENPPSETDAAAPGETPEDAPLRDPTQPSPRMRELLAPPPASAAGGSRAVQEQLPPLVLKARLIGGRGPAIAVLELDQQQLLVREGSELAFGDSRWAGQRYRVVEISAEAVRLETSSGDRSWSIY